MAPSATSKPSATAIATATRSRNPYAAFLRKALRAAPALILLVALPSILGGCGCRCTGLVRGESGRSIAYLMNAESARFCDATRKTLASPATLMDILARDTKTGLANMCATAEVYGGCHGAAAEDTVSK